MSFMVPIHPTSATREIGIFFNENEIVEYGKLVNQWIY